MTDLTFEPESGIADIDALERWLDRSIALPGGIRWPMARAIGFIPGVGDLCDSATSLYIIVRAIQLGVPRESILRMIKNAGIQALAGAVPFAGELFGFGFKGNRRNFMLLKSYLAEAERD